MFCMWFSNAKLNPLASQGINRSGVMLVRQSGGDLLLQLNGSEERIVVRGQFSNPADRIEQIVFGDGTVRQRWDVRVAANDAGHTAQPEWRAAA